jgi:hypothetical protein
VPGDSAPPAASPVTPAADDTSAPDASVRKPSGHGGHH